MPSQQAQVPVLDFPVQRYPRIALPVKLHLVSVLLFLLELSLELSPLNKGLWFENKLGFMQLLI